MSSRDLQITAKVLNSADVLVELRMTMTLSDWKAMAEQMNTSYPSWRLSSAIRSMIQKISAQVSDDMGPFEP